MQQTILLTNQLATGSAFALTEGSNENVFIPSKVMFGHSVRLGQKVQAIVVPNMTRPDRTPWLAVSILDADPVSQDDTCSAISKKRESHLSSIILQPFLLQTDVVLF